MRAGTATTVLWMQILALIVAPGVLFAAQVTARVEPSPVVLGDSFGYVIELDARVQDVSLPEPIEGEVRLIGGPNTSSSMQIINGRHSLQTTVSWTFQTQKIGTVSFGPAKVVVDGKTLTTTPITVEVIPVPVQKLGGLGEVSSARTGNSTLDQQLKGRLFSFTEVPEKIHAGQAFHVKTYLYRQANFNPSIAGTNLLDTAGGRQFIRVEEASFRIPGIQWESVNVDGVSYQRTALEVSTLVPTRAGKATLKGSKFEVVLETSAGNRRRDPFFDSFFNRNLVNAQLPAYEQEIEILPLPSKPAEAITQLVGNYQITSFADRTELTESELLTLTIRISGTGYLQTVSMENLPEFEGFARINEEVSFQINNIHGELVTTKVFKVVLQANQPGGQEIPALQFAVFDPKQEEQRLVSTQPIGVTVRPSAGSSLQLTGGLQSPVRGEMRQVGKADILFIDTEPLVKVRLRSSSRPFFALPWYWALHGGALLLVVAAVGWSARQRRLHSDPLAYRARLAARRAHEALREADRLRDHGTREQFYSALAGGILHRIAALTGREASGLTAEDALAQLRGKGLDEEKLTRLGGLLDGCDAMRYAPESTTEDRHADLQQARELIVELGREKR